MKPAVGSDLAARHSAHPDRGQRVRQPTRSKPVECPPGSGASYPDTQGEVQGRGGEDELGTELHSQEFLISKSAMNQNFTPKFT